MSTSDALYKHLELTPTERVFLQFKPELLLKFETKISEYKEIPSCYQEFLSSLKFKGLHNRRMFFGTEHLPHRVDGWGLRVSNHFDIFEVVREIEACFIPSTGVVGSVIRSDLQDISWFLWPEEAREEVCRAMLSLYAVEDPHTLLEDIHEARDYRQYMRHRPFLYTDLRLAADHHAIVEMIPKPFQGHASTFTVPITRPHFLEVLQLFMTAAPSTPPRWQSWAELHPENCKTILQGICRIYEGYMF